MVNAPAFLHPLLRHAVQLLWREARLLLPLPLLRPGVRQAARQQAGGHRREYGPTHHGSFLIHAFTFSRPDANGNVPYHPAWTAFTWQNSVPSALRTADWRQRCTLPVSNRHWWACRP